MFYSVGMIAPVLFFELILLSALNIFPFRLTASILFFCPIFFLLTIRFFTRLENKWKGISLVLQSAYACFLFYGGVDDVDGHARLLSLTLAVLPRYISF